MFIPFNTWICIAVMLVGNAISTLALRGTPASLYSSGQEHQDRLLSRFPYRAAPLRSSIDRRPSFHTPRRLVPVSTIPVFLLGGLCLASLLCALVCLCAYVFLSIQEYWLSRCSVASTSSPEDGAPIDDEAPSIKDTSHSSSSVDENSVPSAEGMANIEKCRGV